MVQSNRRTTVAEIAEKVHAGSDIKVSGHTEHHSLFFGLYGAADQSGCSR